MLRVEIDRRTWYRGHGPDDSRLQNSEGGRCCLGFELLARGQTEESITNKRDPRDLEIVIPGMCDTPWGPWARLSNPGINTMMIVNDHQGISDATREVILKDIAKARGVEYVFIN